MVRKRIIYFLLLLILVLVVRAAYAEVNADNYYWDEVVFLELAEEGYLSESEEVYRPPLFPFLLSFFGEDYGHLFVLELVFCSIFLVYLLGEEMFSTKTGLIAATIFGAMPLYFFYSVKLLTEPLAIIWILMAFFMVVKYEKNNSDYFLYLAAFFLGLAVLTRYLCLVLVFSFLIYAVYRKWSWVEIVKSGGAFIVTLSPLFILGWINYGNPLGMLLVNLFDNTTATGTIFYYFTHFFSMLGFFVPILFVLGLRRWKKVKHVLIFMVAYFVALSLLSQHYERFFILLLPFFAIIAAQGVVYLDRWNLGRSVLLLWVVIALFAGVEMVDADKDNTAFLIQTAEALQLNGTVMSNSPAYFSYFGDMDVVNFPEDLENIGSISYFVVDNYHPRGDSNYTSYVNYLKDNKEAIYTFNWEHREIIVYEEKSNA